MEMVKHNDYQLGSSFIHSVMVQKTVEKAKRLRCGRSETTISTSESHTISFFSQ